MDPRQSPWRAAGLRQECLPSRAAGNSTGVVRTNTVHRSSSDRQRSVLQRHVAMPEQCSRTRGLKEGAGSRRASTAPAETRRTPLVHHELSHAVQRRWETHRSPADRATGSSAGEPPVAPRIDEPVADLHLQHVQPPRPFPASNSCAASALLPSVPAAELQQGLDRPAIGTPRCKQRRHPVCPCHLSARTYLRACASIKGVGRHYTLAPRRGTPRFCWHTRGGLSSP